MGGANAAAAAWTQRYKRLQLFDIHTHAHTRTQRVKWGGKRYEGGANCFTAIRQQFRIDSHTPQYEQNIHLHASCAPSGESTAAQLIHAQANMGPILCDLPRTWQPSPPPPSPPPPALPLAPPSLSFLPRRPSPAPQTKYLQTCLVFISIFISRSACLHPRLCGRARAGACAHFVRAAC